MKTYISIRGFLKFIDDVKIIVRQRTNFLIPSLTFIYSIRNDKGVLQSTLINSLLSILILIFIASCSDERQVNFHESSKETNNLALKKVNEITLSHSEREQAIIGNLRFKFVSNRDNTLFAFYDKLNKHFVITDNRGRIQRVVSKEGRGPGEVTRVMGYDFNGQNQLVAYDSRQVMLKIFDLNSRNSQDISINKEKNSIMTRSLGTFKGHIYFPIIGTEFLRGDFRKTKDSPLVGVFDYDGTLTETFGKFDQAVEDAKTYDVMPFIHIDRNKEHIISARPNDYRMQVYDLNTKEKLLWFGIRPPSFQEPDDYISQHIPVHEMRNKVQGLSITTGIYTTSNYLVLHYHNLSDTFHHTWNRNENEQYIVIYDRETYDSYGEIAIPYTIGNIADDKLYLIENNNPENYTIGVYELYKDV